MEERINIVNKYSGDVIETITGHLKYDYYMKMAQDTIQQHAIEDLTIEGEVVNSKNIQKTMEEGYDIQVEDDDQEFSEYCKDNIQEIVLNMKEKIEFLEDEVKHLRTMDKIQNQINEKTLGWIKEQNRKI